MSTQGAVKNYKWLVFVFVLGFCLSPTLFFIKSTKNHAILSWGQDLLLNPTKAGHPDTGHFDNFIVQQLKQSEKLYQNYVVKRNNWVGTPETYSWWPYQKGIYMWDTLLPTFNCPYSIQRIGKISDGGKYVCGFEFFDKTDPILRSGNQDPCIVYSFGIFKESSFEAEILERSDCTIFAYDGSVDSIGPQVNPRHPSVKFFKSFIKAEGNHTLGFFMRQNRHKWIDILKMDIEGDELSVLPQILKEFHNSSLPFGQLLIEVHLDSQNKASYPAIYRIWEQLESAGLRPFKNEINLGSLVFNTSNMHAIEYSILNVGTPSRLIPKAFRL